MISKIQASRSNFYWIKWSKIVIGSILIGFLASIFALILKHITENYEHLLFSKTEQRRFLVFLFPLIGLGIIHFLRLYLFKNKKNKGISEVFDTVYFKKKLPSYKITSHFINGFLTVIFGGSTGIEVSTVVSTATMGELASTKDSVFKKYKNMFIGAAIAAGVTILFNSPLAGIFFSYENILKKRSKIFIVTHSVSVAVAYGVSHLFDEAPLFSTTITTWNYSALPYFVILSIIAAVYGVYLTLSVINIKKKFLFNKSPLFQIIFGAILISSLLFIFPELYGDGYHTIKQLIQNTQHFTIGYTLLGLAFIILIKPIITAITLSAGGDGGIFAPSIFAGAVLGLLIGLIVKNYFAPEVYLINFMVIGVAVTLSATLHAPLTAIFLVCGIFNSYALIIPLISVVFISKYLARFILPYTVYTVGFRTLPENNIS